MDSCDRNLELASLVQLLKVTELRAYEQDSPKHGINTTLFPVLIVAKAKQAKLSRHDTYEAFY